MAWGPGYDGLGNGQTLPPLSHPSAQHHGHHGRHAAGGVPLAPNLQEALIGVSPAVISRWAAPLSIIVPSQRKVAPGRLPTLRFSKRQLQQQAEKREILVPIRLDLDADGYRLRDTFMWDLNNELVLPTRFAQSLCIDLDLPQDIFVPLIVQSIDEQLDDFRQYGHGDDALVWIDDELRVVIRIDIIVGHIALRDQFEWDVAPLLRPLRVARVMCSEKGLGGEFETAIGHAIREQLYAFGRYIIQVDDRELARSVLPPLSSALRDAATSQTFAPLIVHLHSTDVDRLEKDTDRETRRKRR
ncbi:SNF5-domain-containing protein, partial [Martensiomyces pterosporus]